MPHVTSRERAARGARIAALLDEARDADPGPLADPPATESHAAIARRHAAEGERGIPGWVVALRREAGTRVLAIAPLARRYAVSNPTVWLILRNETYHDPAYTPPTLPEPRPDRRRRPRR